MTNSILSLIGLSARANTLSFGADSVEEKIKRNRIKLVIIAKDSSDRTKEKYKNLCETYKMPIIIDGCIDELSKAAGKSNKAIFGIQDIHIAKGIQEKYNGGDIIG